MKNRKILLLIMSMLLFSVSILFLQTTNVSAGIKNNGNNYVQYNKNIYCITKDSAEKGQCKYTLYRLESNNSKKALDSWTSYGGDRRLYIYKGKIYYEKLGAIYSNSTKKKNVKKVCEGELYGMYKNKLFYYKDKSLYQKIIKKNSKEKLLKKFDWLTFINIDGKHLLLNNTKDNGKYNLIYVDMKKSKVKTIATENESIVECVVHKNYVYYVIGHYEGSGGFFYDGVLKKVSLNGKNATTMVSGVGETLHKYKGKLYYYKPDSNYFIYEYSFAKNKHTHIGSEDYYGSSLNKYVYASSDFEKQMILYRYSVNETYSDKKSFAKIKKTSDYTYSLDNVNIVGKYLFVEIDIRDFESPWGWRGVYKGTKVYKMKLSGKGIKKIK